MNERKIALKVDDRDNVATIFAQGVADGDQVEIRDKRGHYETVCVHGDVPYGHKIAAAAIPQGAHVIKYGESIGAASRDIAPGEYVHIHNMEALRGRGDIREET